MAIFHFSNTQEYGIYFLNKKTTSTNKLLYMSKFKSYFLVNFFIYRHEKTNTGNQKLKGT